MLEGLLEALIEYIGQDVFGGLKKDDPFRPVGDEERIFFLRLCMILGGVGVVVSIGSFLALPFLQAPTHLTLSKKFLIPTFTVLVGIVWGFISGKLFRAKPRAAIIVAAVGGIFFGALPLGLPMLALLFLSLLLI